MPDNYPTIFGLDAGFVDHVMSISCNIIPLQKKKPRLWLGYSIKQQQLKSSNELLSRLADRFQRSILVGAGAVSHSVRVKEGAQNKSSLYVKCRFRTCWITARLMAARSFDSLDHGPCQAQPSIVKICLYHPQQRGSLNCLRVPRQPARTTIPKEQRQKPTRRSYLWDPCPPSAPAPYTL